MKPIFAKAFGDQWGALPAPLKAHYANRPFTRDVVTHEGALDITLSPVMRRFAWLLKLGGLLAPFEGKAVPVTVYTRSDPASDSYIFERHFFPPNRPPHVFKSELIVTGPHEVIEYFRFGGGWKADYSFEDGRVLIRHKGFTWRLFGRHIPLPGLLKYLFGTGVAWETAIDESSFAMQTALTHALHRGPLIGYAGAFRITEVKLDG
ncbi:hypothetical protein ABI_14500 [Asticcacaulis biprosthecium C19]|uniref:DUF4166 domain-containing protein n=1 Tax=Asticcacaulis biprosthecium C19 TaxID=715226 RepID=F4QIU8_9CAUL|nr:DUF4166 domain-containing protein [Asticcacaulis biprosthecium]EGF93011.1 hypothetical protein ABI_14500 [Asticcacaulis biprosthecium C19]